MMEIQHTAKRAAHAVDIPNLVELQLNSFRWFLEEGLNELFDSFSPIYDFTGSTGIELIDFTDEAIELSMPLRIWSIFADSELNCVASD